MQEQHSSGKIFLSCCCALSHDMSRVVVHLGARQVRAIPLEDGSGPDHPLEPFPSALPLGDVVQSGG